MKSVKHNLYYKVNAKNREFSVFLKWVLLDIKFEYFYHWREDLLVAVLKDHRFIARYPNMIKSFIKDYLTKTRNMI